MNISPVSFGKVIRITNKSTNAINRVVELINGDDAPLGERKAQKDLKKVFNDTQEGAAIDVSVFRKDFGRGHHYTYIVTGEPAKKISEMIKPLEAKIQEIRKQKGFEFSREERKEIDMFEAQNRTAINKILSDDEEKTKLSVDYDKNKNKVKSVKFYC